MSTGTTTPLSQQIDRLQTLGLKPRDLSVHKDLPRASVLVPLFSKDDKLHVLLTQRPLHLKSHPGEVCFPGGRQDAEDQGDDIETALRETEEEVGLDRSRLNLVCRLVTVESRGGLCVTPIVGLIRPGDWEPSTLLSTLRVSQDEVEAAFTVPLDYFLEKNGNLVEKFDVPWSGGIFTLRTYLYQQDSKNTFKIWGLTAHVIHEVALIALNGAQPAAVDNNTGNAEDANSVRIEGKLFVWDTSGEYWRDRYFVLTRQGMLHEHPSEAYASRKSSSATKKNRTPLVDAVVTTVSETTDEGKFAFDLQVLDGRIKWRLAATSEEARTRWMSSFQEK